MLFLNKYDDSTDEVLESSLKSLEISQYSHSAHRYRLWELVTAFSLTLKLRDVVLFSWNIH